MYHVSRFFPHVAYGPAHKSSSGPLLQKLDARDIHIERWYIVRIILSHGRAVQSMWHTHMRREMPMVFGCENLKERVLEN